MKSLPSRYYFIFWVKEIGNLETKSNTTNTRGRQKTLHKKRLCAESAFKKWTTKKLLSNIHKVNSFSKHPSRRLKDVLLAGQGNKYPTERSTGSGSSASWVSVPRGCRTKTPADSQCTFVLGASWGRGAKYAGGPCWSSPHQRGKGFTHLVPQLKTLHCAKQEGSDRSHRDRKCSLAKQGRI